MIFGVRQKGETVWNTVSTGCDNVFVVMRLGLEAFEFDGEVAHERGLFGYL